MKQLHAYPDSKEIIQPSNPKWWYDESFINSFEIFDLDNFYPDKYFYSDDPFPVKEVVEKYCYYVINSFKQLTGDIPNTILEAGTSKGWFTKEFQNLGYDIFGLEGTEAGIKYAILEGVDEYRIAKQDLRKIFNLNRKFDILLCTEVAEHIEPPFSANLIHNLTTHGDFIWFSSVKPYVNSAHYHHTNEQPDKFWINLFDFYGYGVLNISTEISAQLYGRGTHIYYNKNKFRFDTDTSKFIHLS